MHQKIFHEIISFIQHFKVILYMITQFKMVYLYIHTHIAVKDNITALN